LFRSFLLLPPNGFLAAFIAEHGLFELAEDRVGDVDIPEDLPESVPQLLLPKIRQVTLSAKARAPIVRVPPLLHFCRDLAIIICAD
jgi:hypothetical protein